MHKAHNKFMDIRQCRHFVEIVDQGTYSRAAETIPISQSALTRSIQNLEQNLGARLLDRTTRGLTLTKAGRKFYARAKFILREVEQVKQEIASGDDTPGSLSLGIAPLFAGNIIPKALTLFQANQPDIDVRIRSELFPELIAGITDGRLDFAFSNLPFSTLPENVTAEPLFDVDIVFLASQNHPLAETRNLTIETLSEYPWAVVDEYHANALYDYIFTQEGMGHSPLKTKTNSLTLLKSLVTQSPYITLLPLHMVEEEIARGDIVKLQMKNAPLTRKGGLLYRSERPDNPVADAFMQTLRKLCS